MFQHYMNDKIFGQPYAIPIFLIADIPQNQNF